jgi:acetoin utilization protein AcuB
MRLAEIMSTPAITIECSASVADARALMRLRRVRHLVVTDRGKPAGVVSDHDLGAAVGPLTEVMSPKLVSATPETTVRAAANLLRGRNVGCLPVFEGKKLVGIVSVSDLLGLLGKGAERPVTRTKRWTLKHRGPRDGAVVRARAGR